MKEVLSGLEQDKYRGIGVLMFDIDHFKSVNDKYGHDTGDQVLRELAATVRRGIGPAQLFIRWGGEEFIVIAAGADLQALESLAESLRERVEAEKFSTVGNITISLGGAVGEVAGFYDLVAAADMALYESKKKGRNKATLADEVFLNQQMLSGASVTAEQVRSAIVDRQLFFVGQPVIDVKENRVVALEALLRWRRTDGEILVPTQFIDKLNQIVLLDAGLYELLTQCKVEYLISIRGQYPSAAVAFNVTIDELHSSSCNTAIAELLDCATGMDRQLIFELSEGSVSDSVDIESINKIIRRYREGGVRIAIDDFGTGSNNLRNLMQLEVDIVKLAPSIAAAIESGQKPLKVLSSLNLMMHNLKVEIYIEGIDTELQSRLLRGLGYRYQQGYHIGSGEQTGPVRH